MARRVALPAYVDGECVFCLIVDGRAPASVVYSDDALLAFMDLRPVTTGHLLVIPRAHSEGLADLPAPLGSRMFSVGQSLAGALRRTGLRCEGVNIFLADGVAAGQEIFHVHLHVIPRYAGDGFRLSADSRVRARSELDEVAAGIRSKLDA
ncbi:HIT family protein [Lentzea sp. NBRC 105346]|uniref:HIT family protein n=1 Tax=Lentzea sp. NBRC 105346 TaxID=3032205 RepID=UPI0024A551A7|nr:HIT family protein [Lentzea sp. NBRC 105346]GLZ31115.1 HIT family protein [Lentzea sp. NBRC 105346]